MLHSAGRRCRRSDAAATLPCLACDKSRCRWWWRLSHRPRKTLHTLLFIHTFCPLQVWKRAPLGPSGRRSAGMPSRSLYADSSVGLYESSRAPPSFVFLVRLCPRLKCGSACKDKASFKELRSPASTQSQALILHFATTTPQHCSLSRFSLSTRISKIYYYHPNHSLSTTGL